MQIRSCLPQVRQNTLIQNRQNTQGNPNFKGQFIVTDPRVLEASKEFNVDMYRYFDQITQVFLKGPTGEGEEAKIILHSHSLADVAVFAQLKVLGLKFQAIIDEDNEVVHQSLRRK